MTIRIGINGFGRIGRTILRATLENDYKDCQVVHINDLTQPSTQAHLLKYDSVHGTLPTSVSVADNKLQVGDQQIGISAIRSPAELPWAAEKVDVVFECTGVFKSHEDCSMHLKAGAPKVLVSAPAKNEDITVVYGVNHKDLTNDHKIVSNGSCTTNCLAPPASVLHAELGIKSGLMTTIHSYTNDQKLLDLPHSDLRRARAGALNMIPTSTGAAKAIGLVIPELAGKIDGLAIRVPTPNVSLVDVSFQVERATTAEQVNKLLANASQNSLKGVMGYTEEPLVSSDFNGNPLSSIVDGSMTKVIDGHLVKIMSWYDNETGFSTRMLDVARLMTT